MQNLGGPWIPLDPGGGEPTDTGAGELNSGPEEEQDMRLALKH